MFKKVVRYASAKIINMHMIKVCGYNDDDGNGSSSSRKKITTTNKKMLENYHHPERKNK